MTNLLLLGFLPSGSEWIIIALVILLLFGGKKIPELMRGLGKGVKSFKDSQADTLLGSSMRQAVSDTARRILQNEYDVRGYELPTPDTRRRREKKPEKTGKKTKIGR